MTEPAFERRVRAVLDLMAVPASIEGQHRQVARVRAVLAEADAADRGRDHQDEWPEPEGGWGLGGSLPCLAQAIRD